MYKLYKTNFELYAVEVEKNGYEQTFEKQSEQTLYMNDRTLLGAFESLEESKNAFYNTQCETARLLVNSNIFYYNGETVFIQDEESGDIMYYKYSKEI